MKTKPSNERWMIRSLASNKMVSNAYALQSQMK